MTSKEHLKKELMVFAIKNDFFGYGSQCYKRKDGKYVSIVDGERFVETAHQLAADWDCIDIEDKKNILDYYFEKELQSDSLN